MSEEQFVTLGMTPDIPPGPDPGSSSLPPGLPRGIEVLIRKAAIDVEFRKTLFKDRVAAAKEIQLDMAPLEQEILKSIEWPQLEAIIHSTRVPETQRQAFLGNSAQAMLVALEVTPIDINDQVAITGIDPDDPRDDEEPPFPPPVASTGIRPW